MKEKIIDFSNGIFTYDQVQLEIEPQELILTVEEGKGIQGNFRCWDLGLSRYSQKEARHLEENRFRIFFFFS